MDLELGWVKLMFALPNMPKFPPPPFCAVRYTYVFVVISVDTFNGCDDSDDRSIQTETEGDFMY